LAFCLDFSGFWIQTRPDAAWKEVLQDAMDEIVNMAKENYELKERVKRLEDYVETLEECGDSLFNSLTRDEALERWKRAKEAKP
jgi:cell division septum initiation protein DivIVA